MNHSPGVARRQKMTIGADGERGDFASRGVNRVEAAGASSAGHCSRLPRVSGRSCSCTPATARRNERSRLGSLTARVPRRSASDRNACASARSL